MSEGCSRSTFSACGSRQFTWTKCSSCSRPKPAEGSVLPLGGAMYPVGSAPDTPGWLRQRRILPTSIADLLRPVTMPSAMTRCCTSEETCINALTADSSSSFSLMKASSDSAGSMPGTAPEGAPMPGCPRSRRTRLMSTADGLEPMQTPSSMIFRWTSRGCERSSFSAAASRVFCATNCERAASVAASDVGLGGPMGPICTSTSRRGLGDLRAGERRSRDLLRSRRSSPCTEASI
mmetsp:Transcript_6399/g.18271  ORF Transcript_6399/g.18271 Transcript_6399/m.18271 type:complete len:235 (+) Transcript_6399:703-1407(+)